MLTPQEVAAFLRVSRSLVYRLAGSGELRASKVGGSLRIRRADLDAYLDANLVRPAARPAPAPVAPAAPTPPAHPYSQAPTFDAEALRAALAAARR